MKLSKKNYTILILACLGHFLVDMMIGVWPLFKLEAGLDLAAAALVTGACVVVGEGLQVYFGSLADRGYAIGLLAFGPFAAAASAFLPYGNSFYFYSFCLLSTYIGSAAFHPTAAGIVASLSTTKTSAVVSIFHASGLLGLALSQSLYSLSVYDLHTPLTWLLAVPALPLAWFAYKSRGKVHAEAAVQNATEKSGAKNKLLSVFMSFFKKKPLRLLYFTLLCNQIVIWSIIFLLPDFLVSRTNEPWLVLGGGHLLYVMGATCAAIPLGFLADKTRPDRVIFAVTSLAFAALYLLLMLPTPSPFVLSVLLFASGGLLGAVPPLALAFGNKLEPTQRGMISAFLMGFVWIFSEGLGVTLSGLLASHFAEEAACNSLICMGIFGLISAFLSFRLFQVGQQEELQGSAEVALTPVRVDKPTL